MFRSKLTLIAVFVLASFCLSFAQAHATLISVDLQASSGGAGPKDFTGVESVAAAADSAFAAADQWNHLAVAPWNNITTNGTYSGLVDSTGTATSAGLAITGTYGAWNSAFGVGDLCGDYWNIRTDKGTGASITWQMTGLMPSTAYSLYLYNGKFEIELEGEPFSYSVGFDALVDIDGDGSLANEDSFTVYGDGQLVTGVTDANGVILGSVTQKYWSEYTLSTEASWAGFQVSLVPEPGTLALLAAGLTGLLAYAWRKRK